MNLMSRLYNECEKRKHYLSGVIKNYSSINSLDLDSIFKSHFEFGR